MTLSGGAGCSSSSVKGAQTSCSVFFLFATMSPDLDGTCREKIPTNDATRTNHQRMIDLKSHSPASPEPKNKLDVYVLIHIKSFIQKVR